MKATDDVILRLEKLRDFLCLKSKVSGEYIHTVKNQIYVLKSWEVEEYKPLIGKPYKKLTKIWVKDGGNINTTYYGVYEKELERVIDLMERDHNNFVKIKGDLESFGFTINKK